MLGFLGEACFIADLPFDCAMSLEISELADSSLCQSKSSELSLRLACISWSSTSTAGFMSLED